MILLKIIKSINQKTGQFIQKKLFAQTTTLSIFSGVFLGFYKLKGTTQTTFQYYCSQFLSKLSSLGGGGKYLQIIYIQIGRDYVNPSYKNSFFYCSLKYTHTTPQQPSRISKNDLRFLSLFFKNVVLFKNLLLPLSLPG